MPIINFKEGKEIYLVNHSSTTKPLIKAYMRKKKWKTVYYLVDEKEKEILKYSIPLCVGSSHYSYNSEHIYPYPTHKMACDSVYRSLVSQEIDTEEDLLEATSKSGKEDYSSELRKLRTRLSKLMKDY